jgi:hypothetical protein
VGQSRLLARAPSSPRRIRLGGHERHRYCSTPADGNPGRGVGQATPSTGVGSVENANSTVMATTQHESIEQKLSPEDPRVARPIFTLRETAAVHEWARPPAGRSSARSLKTRKARFRGPFLEPTGGLEPPTPSLRVALLTPDSAMQS